MARILHPLADSRPDIRKGRPTRDRTAVPRRCDRSAAKPEALDERAVARDVDVLQVAEQPPALADEQQQATTRVVVVLVLLQVLGEVLDAGRQDGDLHLRGPRVTRVRRVLLDDRLLGVSVQCHAGSFLLLRGAPARMTGALSIRGRSTATRKPTSVASCRFAALRTGDGRGPGARWVSRCSRRRPPPYAPVRRKGGHVRAARCRPPRAAARLPGLRLP